MLEWLKAGGDMMYVLLLVAVVSLGIMLERAYVLFVKLKINANQFVTQVTAFIEQGGNFSRALELCGSAPNHPLPRIIKAGLLKGNKSDTEIQRAMEEEASRVVPGISRRIGYISMCANIATLIGLLGTIQGLIQAFEAVGAAEESQKQAALSAGISVAMLTTLFGLGIAIPCIVGYTLLVNKQSATLDKIDEISMGFFNFLSDRNRALAAKQKRS